MLAEVVVGWTVSEGLAVRGSLSGVGVQAVGFQRTVCGLVRQQAVQ